MNQASPTLTLYSFALSPFVLKVRCYLLYKQLPFHTQYVNPGNMRAQLPVGRTVPVLQVGEDSRNESSAIGLWLEELFPQTPPLIPEGINKDAILEADNWVSQRLIPALFRIFLGIKAPVWQRLRQRWSASAALKQTSPNGFSLQQRIMHALFVDRLPFIQHAVAQTDMTLSNEELRVQISREFADLLGDGPFLCGSQVPTLADCSAFAIIATPYLRGDGELFLPGSSVTAWARRMKEWLPEAEQLLPADLRQQSLAEL